MQAITGIFSSQAQAERAVTTLKSQGIPSDKITLLTPGAHDQARPASVPTDAAEQPGIGKAIGAVVGAATGFRMPCWSQSCPALARSRPWACWGRPC